MKELSIYTDGGARGNPGPAGIGYVIFEGDRQIADHGEYIGETTNNQAEYKALIAGLTHAKKLGAESVKVFMDSELIVRQMRGEYKIKNEDLKPLAAEVFKLSNRFSSLSFNHIPREKNKIADALVNQALDEKNGN